MKDAEHTYSSEKQIETTMRYHFIPARTDMVTFRKWQVTSAGEPLEVLVPSTLLVVMENGSFTAGKWFLQKLSVELPYALAISLLLNTHTHTHTHTHTQKKRKQVLNMHVLIHIFI